MTNCHVYLLKNNDYEAWFIGDGVQMVAAKSDQNTVTRMNIWLTDNVCKTA